MQTSLLLVPATADCIFVNMQDRLAQCSLRGWWQRKSDSDCFSHSIFVMHNRSFAQGSCGQGTETEAVCVCVCVCAQLELVNTSRGGVN